MFIHMIFSLFFFSPPPQTSNRCFVSRQRGSGRGDASGSKYNEVSREVIIDNNKANLELLTRAFSCAHNRLVFQLIPSFRLIDIRTRSASNATIPLFPLFARPFLFSYFFRVGVKRFHTHTKKNLKKKNRVWNDWCVGMETRVFACAGVCLFIC